MWFGRAKWNAIWQLFVCWYNIWIESKSCHFYLHCISLFGMRKKANIPRMEIHDFLISSNLFKPIRIWIENENLSPGAAAFNIHRLQLNIWNAWLRLMCYLTMNWLSHQKVYKRLTKLRFRVGIGWFAHFVMENGCHFAWSVESRWDTINELQISRSLCFVPRILNN